jgi:predicted nucleotidyltransferase
MRPSEALARHRLAIRSVVTHYRAENARVFGSVLRGDDSEASDLDILVDPTPETTLFDIGGMIRDLNTLLGVKVDIVTPNALPETFRHEVLAQAEAI